MRALCEAIGECPTDEELFKFMTEVDEDGSGEISFGEFLKAFEKQRANIMGPQDETDMVNAFVLLGGKADRTGEVPTAAFVSFARQMGLSEKSHAHIEALDKAGSGKITFIQFATLFAQ